MPGDKTKKLKYFDKIRTDLNIKGKAEKIKEEEWEERKK
jgi:hypothetical protein